jgi:hypothetical protein
MLTIRHIRNTIDKHDESAMRQIEWTGATIAEIAPETALVCMANDTRIIRGSVEWISTIPTDGSILIFVTADGDPVTITAAAIAIIAAHAGAFVASSVAYSILMGISTIAAGIAISGALNSALAPSSGALPQFGTGSGKKQSNTYGFDEITNTAQNGSAKPIIYGEHIAGGNIVNAWREAIKGIRSYSQTLNMLIAISEGPIQSIGQYTTDQDGLKLDDIPEGMTINGLDPKKLKEVTVSLRLGSNTQSVMPGFEKIHHEYAQEYRLKDSKTIFEWMTRDEVNDIKINIVFPRGLFKVSDTGSLSKRETYVVVSIYQLDGTTLVKQRGTSLEANVSNPLYFTLKAGWDTPLPTGKYIVKVKRLSPESDETTKTDQINIISVLEIQHCAIAYRNTACIGLTIRATDQLSGSTPRVLTMVKGRKVRTSFASETEVWSQNPAWIVRDAATHKRYGSGNLIGDADVDEESFEEWADHCSQLIPRYTGVVSTEARYLFDGMLDAQIPAWEQLQKVAATARTTLLKFGDTIKAVTEKQKVSTQVFGMGNTVKGSLSISYMNPLERYNSIEVRFLNAGKNYAQDQVTSEVPNLDETVNGLRRNTIDLYGITRQSQARRMAEYYKRIEQAQAKVISFEAGVDAIAVEPGHVFRYSHDMPRWGQSGRIIALDALNKIIIERPILFEAGRVYTYLERDNETDETNTIDFEAVGELTTLPIEPIYGATGAIGRLYCVGEKLNLDRKFLCASVKTDPKGLIAQIEGGEYFDSVYSDHADPIESDAFEGELGEVPDSVTDLVCVETVEDDYVSTLSLSWVAASGADRYAIYSRLKGSPGIAWAKMGEVAGTEFDFETKERLGVSIEICVSTLNIDGQQLSPDDSPTIVHTIAREDEGGGDHLVTFPGKVLNLTLTLVSGTKYSLSWNAVSGAHGYEVRVGHWGEGILLYRGSSLSVDVWLGRIPLIFNVRAYIYGYYSPDNSRIESVSVAKSGYSSEELTFDVDFDDSSAVINNCHASRWNGATRLLQSDITIPVAYQSPIVDLGSQANTHVSVAARIAAWVPYSPSSLDLWTSMQHWSWFGQINKRHLAYELYLDYGNNGTTWTSLKLTGQIGKADVVKSARYFRLRITSSSNKIFLIEAEASAYQRVGKLFVTALSAAFYRS